MESIGIEQIKRILPHREPFLMVDRVDELTPGVSAKGVKAVSANEWFFQGHFAETKVMPGVLIVEALAQAGGIALLTQEAMRGKLAFLGKLTNARFYAPVVPGDLLELDSRIDAVNGSVGKGVGTATVRGKKVATCEFVFALKDPSEL
ncbi:MAG: 3-hydroxyacyl-ACP dehydratase FabZ [Clostridiales bacterium]|nr:3-hydroxyacyl-ACP dehydratase FabZ [Clostridiales bacterium]